jgi:hypothetical protein
MGINADRPLVQDNSDASLAFDGPVVPGDMGAGDDGQTGDGRDVAEASESESSDGGMVADAASEGPSTDATSADADDGSGQAAICMAWIPDSTNTPYLGNATVFSNARTVQLEAENYDKGGEGVSYHDTTPCNDLGILRTGVNEGVDVENKCSASGTCDDVAEIRQGEWTKYTINVATAGNYQIWPGYAAFFSTEMSILLDGTPATGMVPLPATGSLSVFKGGAASRYYPPTFTTGGYTPQNIALPPGQHVLTFEFVGASDNLALNWIMFTYVADAGIPDAGAAETGTAEGGPTEAGDAGAGDAGAAEEAAADTGAADGP